MSKISRKFKGVWIPAEIWLHKDLSWLHKCMLAEIDSLSDKSEGCVASNDYLGEMFGISPKSMANELTALRKFGAIIDVSFNGRDREIRVNPAFTKVVNDGVTKVVSDGGPSNITRDTIELDTNYAPSAKKESFKVPSRDEIALYAPTVSFPVERIDEFISFYETNGWTVSGRKMKCWKAAIRYWVNRAASKPLTVWEIKQKVESIRLAMASHVCNPTYIRHNPNASEAMRTEYTQLNARLVELNKLLLK